jgi:hypothetical protein
MAVIERAPSRRGARTRKRTPIGRHGVYATRSVSYARRWAFAGLGLAPNVGLVGSRRPFASIRSRDRILLVGDELALGLGPPFRQLAKDDKIELHVEARKGTRIRDWATHPWLAQAMQSQPQLVLVSLGLVDMRTGAPALHGLEGLLLLLRGARAVWVAPPVMPFPDAGVRALLDATGIPVFRSESFLIPRGPDGIYPTAAGYAAWAGQLFGRLRESRP